MRLFPTIAALAAMTFGCAAAAHEYKVGDLTIEHPYAIETAAGARSAAGYFTVTNAGTAPDNLIDISAEVMTQIHDTKTDDAGVTRMTPVGELAIPPGASVTLAPRGLHVMFMGLTEPWKAGDKIPAILVFERAGEVRVTFNVEPRNSTGEMEGMEGMHH